MLLVTFLGSLSQFGTTYRPWFRRDQVTSCIAKMLHAGVEVLQAGVEGPCLHRPEIWLVRQLNDEPKPVYKVRFIIEKGKATARVLQQSPEASNSLLR
jgi:hypothetical protein